MAYHNATWADCSYHDHLAEARTLLERFWEDHRTPPPGEAAPPDLPLDLPPEPRDETPGPVVHVAMPVHATNRVIAPRQKTALGVLVGLLIVAILYSIFLPIYDVIAKLKF